MFASSIRLGKVMKSVALIGAWWLITDGQSILEIWNFYAPEILQRIVGENSGRSSLVGNSLLMREIRKDQTELTGSLKYL